MNNGPTKELTELIIGSAMNAHKALGPGLLVNFNVRLLKQGIRRFAN